MEPTARFSKHFETCPLRLKCTTAKSGRTIKLHPRHQLLADAWAQAVTDEFNEVYRNKRPMIERIIAWLMKDGRRLRHRVIERNRIWWSHRCAAINIKRGLNLGLTYNNGWTMATSAATG